MIWREMTISGDNRPIQSEYFSVAVATRVWVGPSTPSHETTRDCRLACGVEVIFGLPLRRDEDCEEGLQLTSSWKTNPCRRRVYLPISTYLRYLCCTILRLGRPYLTCPSMSWQPIPNLMRHVNPSTGAMSQNSMIPQMGRSVPRTPS